MNTVNTSVLCRSLAQAVQRLWGLLGDLTEPLGNGPKHLALGIPACVTWHLEFPPNSEHSVSLCYSDQIVT